MKTNKKGFTLVELLVVLVIVGILAAVATPLYLSHTRKARAAEAVATMGLVRQALRDFQINRGTYFTIATNAAGNIQNALPTAVTAATPFTPTPATAGVEVDAGVAQYFSNSAFDVDASAARAFAAPAAIVGNPTAPVDFLISARGNTTDNTCGAVDTNCATRGAEVLGDGAANGVNVYRLEMDNAGRIFVCYTNCGTAANWSAY